jgi:Mrp family chromosome partitioning ATPase/uncharacterized protein involved in exopolysaccharide biosynthesis
MANATEVDVSIVHPAAAAADPYAMVRQALRGRYVQFVVLIFVGALAGAVAGWKLGKPLFRGEAEVRVAYATPQVTGGAEDISKWAGPFDMIMRGQEQNVSSRPVVEMALRDPAWQASLPAAAVYDVRRFHSQLEVQRVGGSDHLRVMFTDYDPVAAAAGVNAVVRSYINDFKSKGAQVDADRGKNLAQLVSDLERRVSEISRQTKAISQDFGVADVESLYDIIERRVSLLEAKTVDVQMVSSASRSGATGGPQGGPGEHNADGGAGTTAAPGQPAPAFQAATPAEISAGGNELMRQYLADQDRVQAELEEATSIRRLGEAHPEVRRLTKLYQKAKERVDAYANEYNKTQSLLARYPEAVVRQNPAALAGRPAEAIRADLTLVTRLRDDAKDALVALAAKRQEVRELKAQADQLRLELAKLKARQDMLQVESLPDHRIEVVEMADVPPVPFKDIRKQYAAAGVVAGGGLPAALVVLFGLLNRRFRFSDEAESRLASSAPLLGILTSLPQRMTDPEQAAGAAQCVHQIRVLLQVGGGSRKRRRRSVYLMTSTTPGEGKTSLTVSLGLSFAAAGARTLVIDCDLVAQRITRGFNLAGQPGLRDALAAGTVRGFAKKTASGLWVTPVGTADVLDACAVSATDMNRLLADARRYFDTIIIDSGPILGSVEATTVAAQTDGVIFAVSRGQEPRLVEKALKHLESLGAPIAGFVFNRAERKDFSRSAHASSLRSIPSSSIPTRGLVTDTESCGAFGPLVQSVVSLVPSARQFAEPQVDSIQQETSTVAASPSRVESRVETSVGA